MAFLVRRLPGKEGDPMARMKNRCQSFFFDGNDSGCPHPIDHFYGDDGDIGTVDGQGGELKGGRSFVSLPYSNVAG